MTTDTKTAWRMKAAYLETCSCDFGCPCNFEAPPTKGYCSFVLGWHINEGHFGDVSLDGLNIAGAGWFPEAMHLGNGTMIPYVDERATPEQRSALLTIMTGAAAVSLGRSSPRSSPMCANRASSRSTSTSMGATALSRSRTWPKRASRRLRTPSLATRKTRKSSCRTDSSSTMPTSPNRRRAGSRTMASTAIRRAKTATSRRSITATPSEGAIVLRLIAVPQSDRGPVLAILAALGLLAWLTLADPLGLGIASAFDHHELLEDASGSQIVARFPLFVGRGR